MSIVAKSALGTALLALASLPASAQTAGNADQGKRLYGRCLTCHTLDAGRHRVGPSLFGIFGATAGAAKGFAYSASLVELGKKGLKWDEKTLADYMADPAAFTKAQLKDPKAVSKMLFRVPNAQQRLDIAAYLKAATSGQKRP